MGMGFSPLQYYVYNNMSTIYTTHKTVASWLTVRLPSYADFVISKSSGLSISIADLNGYEVLQRNGLVKEFQ